MADVLHVEQDGAIRLLTLNRPEKRNALSAELLEALLEQIDSSQSDNTRVMIITGRGSAFCAGLDVNELNQVTPEDQPPVLLQRFQQLLQSVEQSPCIVIAAVNGFAVAGGAALVTACDLAAASEQARIGYPEIRSGRVAALVMPALVRQIGEREARYLLLTGELITGSRAREIGLVNEITKPADLLPRCRRLAENLLLLPAEGLRLTKQWLHDISGCANQTRPEMTWCLYQPPATAPRVFPAAE